jgi:hypothetical protein
MKWIRSPIYDSALMLNAPLAGLLMLAPFCTPLPAQALMMGLLVVNFAHVLAPIALAWSHRGYRAVMLQRPAKFVRGPAVVMTAGAVAAAAATWALFPAYRPLHVDLEDLPSLQGFVPFVFWAALYAVWNLYHAGAQNFGLICLYRRRGFAGRGKLAVLAACIAATVLLGREVPRYSNVAIVSAFCIGCIFVNHWTAAIGLTAHVHSRHTGCSPVWFIMVMLAIGGGLAWVFYAAIMASPHLRMIALSLRGALGMWHFLQDRWLWQLSRHEVRNTIGRDLFAVTTQKDR